MTLKYNKTNFLCMAIFSMKYINIIIIISLCLCLSGCLGFESTPERTVANVTRIVDGDTVVIDSGEKVRLVGVDTPEVDEAYYEEAKQYMVDNVLGEQVELEADVSNRDDFGRLLRYVWLDGELINEQLVLSGLAVSKTYEPDTRYQETFDTAQSLAREKSVGLWSGSSGREGLGPETEEGAIYYIDAGRYIGHVKTVEGVIVDSHDAGNIIFLNFHDPYEGYFTVVIYPDDRERFPQSPEIMYYMKKVRVTGKIIDYKGSPEIVVDDPSQIEIL